MNCIQCDALLGPDDVACPECGTEVAGGTVPMDPDATDAGVRSETGQMAALQGQLQQMLGDSYQVEHMLGRGGMGAVFLARERKLDRHVAIKVLPPGLSFDDQFTARFVREARTAAKLDHPNIVPIYSVEDEGDLLFFIMKYVPGTDLGDEIRSNPPDLKRIQKLIWESACALGHAHSRGVIHRDVKPGNIMIDEVGRPLLTDFGISKAATNETQYTATGQMIGTPTYMSPEQAKGLPVDGRTDQYALGVVAYQMLAGRVPFDDASVHTLIYKQIFQDPEPIKNVRPDCPDDLAEAIHRSLQKEPRDRFDTMEEFATAVWPENPVQASSMPDLKDVSVYDGEEEFTGTRETSVLAGTKSHRTVVRNRRALMTMGAVAALAAFGWAYVTVSADESAGGVTGVEVAGSGVAAVSDAPPVETVAQGAVVEPTPPPMPEPDPQPAPARTPPRQTAPPAAVTTGTLNVNVRPVWGTVYIDGREIRASPLFGQELEAGEHVVEIRRAGYVTLVDTVLIEAGNATTRNFVIVQNN